MENHSAYGCSKKPIKKSKILTPPIQKTAELTFASRFLQAALSLVLVSCLLGSGPAKASIPTVFSRLGTGLDTFPNERFTHIFQGSYGFMWLGHARGLLRYDGSAIRWYRHQPGDLKSLPPGGVRCIYEDKAGHFWIGTNGGLASLDRVTGHFFQIPLKAEDTPLSAKNIWALQEDASGTLWVGTAAGLFYFKDGGLHPSPANKTLPEGGVNALLIDSRQQLWLASQGSGLFTGSPMTTSFKAVPGFQSQKISALLQADNHLIWVGTLEHGVHILNPESEQIDTLQTGISAASNSGPNPVQSLVKDRQDRIWIGTQEGLHVYDSQGNHLAPVVPTPGRSDRLRDGNIQALYVGNQELLWVATSVAGIDLMNLNQTQIQSLQLEDKGCLALAQSVSGEIFMGTREGLALFDPASQSLRWRLKEHTIRAVHLSSHGRIYAGTGSGLFLVGPATDPSQDRHLAFKDRIWAILEDESQHLWLASDVGLLRYEPLTGKSHTYPVKADDAKALNYQVATSLALQGPDYLWVGTFGGGVNRLHLPSGRFDHFQAEPHATYGLVANDVVDLHMDREKRLWIATLSGGLHRHDPYSESFTPITLSSQHHDLTPIAITSDAAGFIWLSTGAGLLRYDPQADNFVRIRPIDGLDIGSALPGAISYDLHRREIMVGGIEGMGRFDPENFSFPAPGPMIFTSFKAGQEEIRHLMLPDESLWLPRQYKSFTVSFAMLDYLSLQEQDFAFRRMGIDGDWVSSGRSGEVNYTHLGGFGGEHTLEVKISPGNGPSKQATFTTHLQPPRWLSWLPLAVLLVFGMIVFLIYGFISWKEKRKRLALEQKAQLADQRRILAETQAQVAEKARSLEQKERQFQEEHAAIVQQFLERRATEIANDLHDGPLGSLHGLGFTLHALSENAPSGNLKDTLIHLTEMRLPQIRDHLRRMCGDLLSPDFNDGLVPELETLISNTARSHADLTFSVEFTLENHVLSKDLKTVLFRIFRILLANMEKHAQATHVDISLKQVAHEVQLSFKDNGCGFEVPASWDQFKEAQHFGLYMVVYFTQMLGGAFKAESEPGEGSSFHVAVPLPKR